MHLVLIYLLACVSDSIRSKVILPLVAFVGVWKLISGCYQAIIIISVDL